MKLEHMKAGVKMSTNLTVLLPDRPGAIAEVGEALGAAGVNIEGISAFVVNGQAFGHLLVDDGVMARRALDGIADVAAEGLALVVEVEDRPGAFGRLTRQVASRGVNLKFIYLATNTRVVLGADDLDGALAAVS